MSDGNGDSASYSYLANSALAGQITFAQSGATRMTTSKQYDYLNRLSSVSSSSNSFAYSYNAANQRTQAGLMDSCLWGSDLSGSMQGAGGVGGLIQMSYYGATTTNCFVAYDGNGNVSALVNASNGATVANYEYGPFGEVIRSTGPMAKLNPFRFSTKYDDDETDLLYYGYRYYNPSTGRWISRDPIGEKGGYNLYVFTDGDPINYLDVLGLNALQYTSDGEWYVNGYAGTYTFTGSASGKRTSSVAYFMQNASVVLSDNGICDSGGTRSSSSFVTATVKNTCNSSLNVSCECTIGWSGSATTVKYDTAGFVVNDTVLDKSFHHAFAGKGPGTGSPPVFTVEGVGQDPHSESFTLAAGASKELYYGYVSVSVSGTRGNGFSAYMFGSCTCSAK